MKLKNIALLNLKEGGNPNYLYLSKQKCVGMFLQLNKLKLMIVPEMEAQRVKGIRKIVSKTGLLDELNKQLKKYRIKKLALDYSNLTFNQLKIIKKTLKGIKFEDCSKYLSEQRTIKTKSEINNIKQACKLTERILDKTIKNIRFFKKESEIKAFLINETIKQNLELSFDPIVASGKNASIPHYKDPEDKIRKGFLIIDFGVKYKNYGADLTRTVYIGKPSKKELSLYEKVRKTQQYVAAITVKDADCSFIDESARRVLGKELIHSLGHGIGVEEHELPRIGPSSKDKFKEGMVFAIEPGIYKEGRYGIRIEDNFTIEKGRIKKLSSMKNKLIII